MKRIKIFITLMYLISFFFIVGCKKNSSVINEEKTPYIPLDFSKTNVGQLHNQYVTAAFDRIKSTLHNPVMLTTNPAILTTLFFLAFFWSVL